MPWGIGIHGGDRGYESDGDDQNLDIGTPRHGEAVETNGEKETRIFSPGSAGKGMASSSSRISAHTNSAGRARYTMHVLDTEGIVRGLHSMRQNRTLVEETREERLTRHYEAILASRDLQVVAADDEAVKALRKYRLCLTKLQKLIRASQEHERSVRDSNARVKRAKEELAATREAMGAQSAMLSQRVMELEETGSCAAEMVDRLANNEVRCVHCHGWNRIGRIVGKVGEDMKACLHCNRNPGFRSLNDEA